MAAAQENDIDDEVEEEIDRSNVPIAEKMMVKYLGNLEHPMAQALLNMQKKGQSAISEISSKYYSTWDYKENLIFFSNSN